MPKSKESPSPFDAAAELAKIRNARELSKREPFRRSKLSAFSFEIIALDREGASLRDIQTWLRRTHNLKVHPSTISRYLKQHRPLFFYDKGAIAMALTEL